MEGGVNVESREDGSEETLECWGKQWIGEFVGVVVGGGVGSKVTWGA